MLPCRYAEYETKLEALRVHRKALMGLQGKTTLADYAIVKRIHLIFERATRKFRGDLRVWLKWLHFCRTSGSTRQISRVYTPCIPVVRLMLLLCSCGFVRLFLHQAALWRVYI